VGYFEIQKYGRMNLLFRRNEVRKGILVRFLKKEQVHKIWKNKAFVKEMERRVADYEAGKVKGYTWDEVKEITRNSLSEMKNNPDSFYDSINLDFSGFEFDRDEANER
jgi:putative addiction module component (TIGR02574 family)